MVQNSLVFDTMHQGPIHDTKLDYYGKCLATVSADHSIRLWDLASDGPVYIAELLGHEGAVWQVSWSHPKFGNLLASCSYDKRIIIWKEISSRQWKAIYKCEDHTSSVNCISFSSWEFGLHVVAGSSDGYISVLSYRPETANWTRKAFQAHPNGVLCVDWSPPYASLTSEQPSDFTSQQLQRRLVSGGCDFQIRIWIYIDTTEEWILSQNINSQRICSGWVWDVAWRPVIGGQHSMIASSSNDGQIVLWTEADNQTWKAKQIIPQSSVAKVSWSITGTLLAVTTGQDSVLLYKESSLGTWELIDSPPSQDPKGLLPPASLTATAS